jgi:hypothetical protein
MTVTPNADDGIDWPVQVALLAESHRKAAARATAAREARDELICALYGNGVMTQVALARATGISQPQIAKITAHVERK